MPFELDASYRDFIPYGACLDSESPHALLDRGQYQDEADRLRLINLGESLCRACPQFYYCEQQIDDITSALWERGIGGVLVGAEYKEVPPGELSPISAERLNLHFDLSEVPSDPDTRLYILRQAVRAGDVSVLYKHDDDHKDVVDWLQEDVAHKNSSLLGQAQELLGPQGTRHSLALITNALMALRCYNLKTASQKAAKAKEVIAEGMYRDDGPIGMAFLEELCEARTMFRELSGTSSGDSSRTQVRQLPNTLLRHSSAYLEDIVRSNLARYSNLTPSALAEIIYRHPASIQPAIDSYIAKQTSAPVQQRYARTHDVNDLPLSKQEIGQAAADPAIQGVFAEHPYLLPYMDKIIAQADPLGYARNLVETVRAHMQDFNPEYFGSIEPSDVVFFALKDPKNVGVKLLRFAQAKDMLTKLYANKEDYSDEVILSLSRQAAVLRGLRPYARHLLDLEADEHNDGSIPISKLHAYARAKAMTYTQAKNKYRIELLKNKINKRKAGGRSVNQNVDRWLADRIGLLYEFDELYKVANATTRDLKRGFLRYASAGPVAEQPDAHRQMAENICAPSGEYVTFTRRLMQLLPTERLVYAYVENLDRLLYGQRINPLALELALNTRDLQSYVSKTLDPKIKSLPYPSDNNYGYNTPLGTLHNDLKALNFIPQPSIDGVEPQLIDTAKIQRVLDTVVANLVGYDVNASMVEGFDAENPKLIWLSDTIQRFYGPVRHIRVLQNAIILMQEGIVEIEDSDDGYALNFSDSVQQSVNGIPPLNSSDMALLANAFEIDLLTHSSDESTLVKERLKINKLGEAKAAATSVYERALKIVQSTQSPETANDTFSQLDTPPDPSEAIDPETEKKPEVLKDILSHLLKGQQLAGDELKRVIDHCLPNNLPDAARLSMRSGRSLGQVGQQIVQYHTRVRPYRKTYQSEAALSLLRLVFGDPTSGIEARCYDAAFKGIDQHLQRMNQPQIDADSIYQLYNSMIQDYIKYSYRRR